MALTALLGGRFAAVWVVVRREDTRNTPSQHAVRATRFLQEDHLSPKRSR